MKLLTQTNRIYLIFSLVSYLLTAIAFYEIVRLLIYDEVESRLQIEKRDFDAYVQAHHAWSSSPYFVENKIDFVPAGRHKPLGQAFTDTLMRNRYDAAMVPFRQLTFYTTIQGVLYRVSIRKSLIQSYRLIEAVTLTMAIFLGLLLVGTFWFQSRLSGRLWQPFNDTLTRIKGFDLSSHSPLQLEPARIDEFSELNDVLHKMTAKMQRDYHNLKEFTENASHEMQTPLALISAKVEQFIQTEPLTTSQSHWIESIYQASRRLSRLNQGLLLLAKIENQQFTDCQMVDLTAELSQRLGDMDEVLVHKQLRVSVGAADQPFVALLPPFLADMLLTNLVSNAIRHNLPGGSIELCSTADTLCLSNTGSQLKSAPMTLFDRFRKEASHTESVGLGLSIVQQICDTHQLLITYQYSNGLHTLTLIKAQL